MKRELALLLVIVNNGYSEEVVNLTKSLGTRGATILNGSGSVKPEAKKIYGVDINPEKEIVLIVVSKELVDTLMVNIYEKFGPTSLAQGVSFSLPINNATTNLYNQFKEKQESVE